MRRINVTAAVLGALGIAGWGAPALADPRLDEKVYSPYIETGVAELETRTATEIGKGDLAGATASVVEAEYGFGDRVSVALLGVNEREPGERARWNEVGVETVWFLGQIPKVGVDAGLYLEALKGLNGEPDGGEAKLLLAKNAGRFEGLLNLIVERPFTGPKSDQFASYGYAASATWRTVGRLQLGVEAFGDFGDDHNFGGRQGAYVGPQLKWEAKAKGFPVDIVVDAGWLAAVGPARDEAKSQARLNLEFEKRF
jgi:hypothetical protein